MNRMTLCRPSVGFSLLAVFLAAPSLAGCGKGLSGTYSKCISINSSSSKSATFVFPDSANCSYQAQPYNAAACAGTLGTLITGTCTYVIEASTVAGAQNLTLTYGDGTLKGVTLYQIFKLDGNQLYLGDASGSQDGTSDAKRPTAFEGTPYTKQ